MTSQLHKRFLNFLVVLAVVAVLPDAANAQNAKIRVTVGQSVTHKVEGANVKTVSIANSSVADVVVVGPHEVLINGKGIGLTTLVIWTEDDVSRIYDVVARGPFSDLKIELRVKLAEVIKSRGEELGFDFLTQGTISGDNVTGGTFGGNVATPSIPLAIFDNRLVEGASGVFRWVRGGSSVEAMVHALISNGVLHVLAEPNVVAASGEEAEFLSGGEIPIPIASSGSTGGSTVTIEWREFGVKVKFIPTIVDSNVVNLYVSTEVSSLDFGNALEISGFRIPALRTRKAKTTVELRNQEILVIGGLYLEEENNVTTRIPILGHIPLLGKLFSDTRNVKTENELMLVVSPHIIRAMPPGTELNLPNIEEE